MCEVAVCQFTATNNKKDNLKTVNKLVADAVRKGAKMAFLPECCAFMGGNDSEILNMAEPLEGPTMTEYKNLAKNLNVWLSIGGFHESSKKSQKVKNSHVLLDNRGEIVAVYRKLHLFDVSIPDKNVNFAESKYAETGTEIIPPIETPAGRLSLSICYDLRFSELSILNRQNGATILSFPSAFTSVTGAAHWEVLLRARAIENQCYVIAAAQYGKNNAKRITYGQSMIVNPWGEIIAECPKYTEGRDTNESVAVALIDPAVLKDVREKLPVFQHKRHDIYEVKNLSSQILPIKNDEVFHFGTKVIPSSQVFLKTYLSFAFTNIRCVVPGHVLISSIRPVARLENLTSEERSDLMHTVVLVQKVIEKVHSASSSTICIQDGQDAGQTVKHVHVHIMPRKPRDFQRNDEIYEKLASHDRDNDANLNRKPEEMSEEAKMLRTFF